MAKDKIIALTATSERPAETFSGYVMLIALLLVVAFMLFGFFNLADDGGGVDADDQHLRWPDCCCS